MSQEEQDRLLGQAVREKAEVDKSLALIGQEIQRLRAGLTEIANQLSHRAHAMGSEAPAPIPVPPEVSKYLDCAKLIALLDEQGQLIQKRTSLNRAIEGSR